MKVGGVDVIAKFYGIHVSQLPVGELGLLGNKLVVSAGVDHMVDDPAGAVTRRTGYFYGIGSDADGGDQSF